MRLRTMLLQGPHVPVWMRKPIGRICQMCRFGIEAIRQVWAAWVICPLFQCECETCGRGGSVERLPYRIGPGRIRIGARVRISGKISILFSRAGTETSLLTIGDDVFIGHGSAFMAAQAIAIGNHCLIGGGVRVQDNDGHPLDPGTRQRGERVHAAAIQPVMIGNNVWIGARATILKGVTIGDNAVVGTGSVVTRDVPANTLVAGVPARIVREL